uniref:MC013L n=1 Tax=Rousettus bat poxvirus TaxID=3141933 RepID=A0AAU7E283_9POXV
MDALRVLGLPEGSSPETIRRRYKELCVRYHPDKNPGAGQALQRITCAYRQLRDTSRVTVTVSLNDVYTGRLVRVPVRGRELALFLPPGVDNGCVRACIGGAECEFVIRVLPDATYARRGHHLVARVTLSYDEAVRGAVKVLHLPGARLLTVRIKPFQAITHRKAVVAGYGFQYNGATGDLHLRFRVLPPAAKIDS